MRRRVRQFSDFVKQPLHGLYLFLYDNLLSDTSEEKLPDLPTSSGRRFYAAIRRNLKNILNPQHIEGGQCRVIIPLQRDGRAAETCLVMVTDKFTGLEPEIALAESRQQKDRGTREIRPIIDPAFVQGLPKEEWIIDNVDWLTGLFLKTASCGKRQIIATLNLP
ncbi:MULTISPECIES: hypothetical protein [unclassified Kosakonia]|uniref:hypothetical protein n=1 Tax=unclassified Kosakonia TaxID=2632876 RepID=UPI0031B725B9